MLIKKEEFINHFLKHIKRELNFRLPVEAPEYEMIDKAYYELYDIARHVKTAIN